jgi:hypothetical protein
MKAVKVAIGIGIAIGYFQAKTDCASDTDAPDIMPPDARLKLSIVKLQYI